MSCEANQHDSGNATGLVLDARELVAGQVRRAEASRRTKRGRRGGLEAHQGGVRQGTLTLFVYG
mgnify:CR=1 FL=1